MKKLTIGATSFIAGALLMTGASVFASTPLEKVSAYVNNTITLKLDGEKVETSQPILTYNDRTYVYLKDVGELVGADVGWNNDERSVEIVSDGVEIENEGIETNGNEIDNGTNIDNQIWYEWSDLVNHLNHSLPLTISSKVVKGNNTIVHNGKEEYTAFRDKDYYVDMDQELSYYNKDFLLKFLTDEDLDALNQYRIDIQNHKITQT